jgi:acetolactate synthase-1/2/3 large subunit
MQPDEPAPPGRAADHLVRRLRARGAEHAFGVSGANIEDVFAAAHRAGGPRIVLAKHEFSAVAMAHGAHLRTGGLGVVLTTSGGGAFNAVAALAEALSSRVPMLAVIGQIPQALEARGGFQDSSGAPLTPDAARVFGAVGVSCIAVRQADELPAALDRSIGSALAQRGPAVLLVPKDVQQAPLAAPAETAAAGRAAAPPEWGGWPELLPLLEHAEAPLVILGEDLVAEAAVEPALELVDKLDARVAVTPGAKGAYDHRSPRFLGVTGVMGHPSVEAGLATAGVCVVIGTPLPLLARYGLEDALARTSVVSINARPSFLGPRRGSSGRWLDVPGPLFWRLAEINARLPGRAPGARAGTGATLERLRVPPLAGSRLSYAEAVAALQPFLEDDADVFVDAGNTGAALVHHLEVRGQGLFFVALGMGGMGYAFGAAIGSAAAARKRTYLFAGDGAFFMHGLELHTAVEHDLPLVAVVFDNRSHAMCELRDELYLGGGRGENLFRRPHLARGMAAMFPSLLCREAADPEAVARAMEEICAHRGPALLAIEIDAREFPPFAPFLDRRAALEAREDRHARR